MPKLKPETEQSQAEATPPVVHVPPVDAGDAGGAGNPTERTIAPGTLLETAEEAEERGHRWAPA